MVYAADLHLHSHFARGTSGKLTFDNMAAWAKLKGIDLLASPDFTHPAWFEETRRKLRERGDGTYELNGVRFVLGAEINCAGGQGGRNRRVHVLAFAPSLDAAAGINSALEPRGALHADGRPTIRATPRELVHLLLDVDPRCFVIPAHAWTPWFGVYGSKSGFDSLEECFGDAWERVPAIETGLSSDPAMNWRVPELDDRAIVSFSDAHSLPKMGRELTYFRGGLDYDGLLDSLRTQNIAHTVEFFPEEGKYHHSGHRKCGVSLSPAEVSEGNGRCPKCGRALTIGVLQRVHDLGRRDAGARRGDDGFTRSDNGRPPFRSMVALELIIAESLGVGVKTKKVRTAYETLVSMLGSEMSALMEAPIADIEAAAGDRVAEGVDRVRKGRVQVVPGFDGQYGTVRIWGGHSPRGQERSPLPTDH